jgi:hypothetical protein
MKAKILICAGIALLLVSCEKYGYNNSLGGTQSAIGEVGNTFTFSNVTGISNSTASVTSLTDGVSTITFSGQVTDTKLLPLAGYLPGVTVSGNNVSGTMKAKITSEGIETVHEGGKLILVKYDAEVGDSYSLKTGDATITREVTSKSTEDDFYWGGMLIKTIRVKETGHTAPGISKIQYIANHKFGLVGVDLYYTDGSSKSIDLFSSATN